jgi:hypothetical protein
LSLFNPREKKKRMNQNDSLGRERGEWYPPQFSSLSSLLRGGAKEEAKG